MRRTSDRTEPRLAAAVGVVLGALLAAGCAGMPDSGAITKVELPQGSAEKNLQVRVFPLEPTKGAKPQELLTGFLDALTADDNYVTARQYLTAAAAAGWKPEAGIQVLASNPVHSDVDVTDADTEITIPVDGQLVSEVDARHSFAPQASARKVSIDFSFHREKSGEWRIAKLPDGLIINETNFRNSYRQVDRFFYAAPDPSAPTAGSATYRDVLIADPIYLRRRIDPLVYAAKAVVAGPSTWLTPVTRTAFPAGTVVDAVVVDDNRTAHVTLGDVDLSTATTCRRMATQLLYTLADQGKGQVERLDLKGRHGGPSCQASTSDEPETGPGSLAGTMASRQFYQRADDGVLYEMRGDTSSDPVRGPLGKPQPNGRAIGAVAVARDGERAAAISADGHQLYTVPLSEGMPAMPQPLLTTGARPGAKGGDGLTSPTWDGRGDLYLVDREPQSPRVLMVRDKQVVPVPVEGLGGRSLQAVKVSSDGIRIALLVGEGKEAKDQKLLLGLVVHGGTKEAPTARITDLRLASPVFQEVVSVSWAEADQLLVLGTEKGRQQQLYYISTDGSPSTGAVLQSALMAAAQASEARGSSSATPPPPLGLETGGKLYRLVNNQWRELALPYQASAFIYPG
ncbi:LpqB family beta-propeller domain-containing protein [Kitasatospora sp. NBC_00458]|uniref:LpqB family beta-propeller domain-containing protein n=1 Tax=Kitasatospora sp. NBC_00458 TaxID=2903568 RepID=UPI002E16B6D4